jgi:hypothetical protein
VIAFLRQQLLVLCGCLFGLECLHAESPRVRALELKDGMTPPELDGVLNDPCWEEASSVTDFSQVFPKEGATPSEPTEVKFVHDCRYLYVGHPVLAQYDNESDSFGVNSRIRWTVRPGTDVYLVLNQGYVVEKRNRLRRIGTEAALKAGVTWRF